MTETAADVDGAPVPGEVLTLRVHEVARFDSRVTNKDGRPRVALLSLPPRLTAFSRAAIGRLNFQPRVCRAPNPCIASRRGDVVTVEFDSTPAGVSTRLTYECHPVRWHGQDIIAEHVVVGVLIDEVSP